MDQNDILILFSLTIYSLKTIIYYETINRINLAVNFSPFICLFFID